MDGSFDVDSNSIIFLSAISSFRHFYVVFMILSEFSPYSFDSGSCVYLVRPREIWSKGAMGKSKVMDIVLTNERVAGVKIRKMQNTLGVMSI